MYQRDLLQHFANPRTAYSGLEKIEHNRFANSLLLPTDTICF
ncbi:unnamed protein product [Linum tenue]|uniref:Uncharacterized protein n=1 Tax=Linum tenue TaxID=586396 RepID=A0AAV0RY70_9ROSI|nr:unnamed protein product [Linum tenue]